jgi:hypothetical protein
MLTDFDELLVVQVNDAERREQQQHSIRGKAQDDFHELQYVDFDELRVLQVNDAERREQQQHSCTRQAAR